MFWFACYFPLVLRLTVYTGNGDFSSFSFFPARSFQCLPHPLRGGGHDPLLLICVLLSFSLSIRLL